MKFTYIFKQKSSMLCKLWLNQFAFSLFGLFVASPFSGTLAVVAGIFSYLFYMFVIGYAVLDDAQKDRIASAAGRNDYAHVTSVTGFLYSLIAYLPTMLLTLVHLILSYIPSVSENVTKVLYMFNRFLLCGEILGIDMGLTNTVAGPDFKPVNLGPVWAVYMSEHGYFPLIFCVLSFIIIGVIYYLGFKAIINVNTTASKQ